MLELHEFHLSPASHRVRIALCYKNLEYRSVPVSLVKDGGEQHYPEYRSLNPQGLLPTLVDGNLVLTQSLAIIEYLDERHPDPPLLPEAPRDRARARQYAQSLCCDVQPLTNLRVLGYLRTTLRADAIARSQWMRHWLMDGLDALELWLSAEPGRGFCVGDRLSVADVCLLPQLHAARRFKLSLEDFPRLCEIERRCLELAAIKRAQPSH